MCIYIYMYICIYIYMYLYIHTRMSAHVVMYIYIYICTKKYATLLLTDTAYNSLPDSTKTTFFPSEQRASRVFFNSFVGPTLDAIPLATE
jgi:hypothetical protein